MRPENLWTDIFLDSGNPRETKDIKDLLGFLDGQTTNPTLVARNPHVEAALQEGKKFQKKELLHLYKGILESISFCIPKRSVSVEVYVDRSTTVKEMVTQGREMASWIPNAHIKFPITREGLRATRELLKEGIRVNMTLCFSQEQAAAVYSATQGAQRGDVFLSPFVGRLDDRKENGMDLIKNILRMYKKGDGHVKVLTASIRNTQHLLYAIFLGSDILTAPFAILKEWKNEGLLIPEKDFTYDTGGLREIPYREIDITQSWERHDIAHELTDQGLDRFSADWNTLML
ncbi:MAG: transaldolase [Candidatus Wildermuthbacteria bacterium RIFCSPLOWO2_02_FULL_47_9c]|uniref:Transaldolase n=1 Tax=Candidatus Wildermuthbacteria bacterium RIFCSPLOWO2_02_FULL_47_9c TaxID=1802466 RepID=A0A1G2RSZ4_9BACT|nr:MAG: transaldolase [Candidatus Wildermuthbacteria bacterium RIFCSPLOWO2_02_FULL_47_9c]